ncbi:MAG TPA: hypothetical protein VNS63_08055 [Blastocatellia bacterium]|nr:hypothetical protein [Blastocatellia bacterium]
MSTIAASICSGVSGAQSSFEQIRANLLELLVSDSQSLVDVVLERAVKLVHFIDRRLKELWALEELRFEVNALRQTA